jgi:hypothetical protein
VGRHVQRVAGRRRDAGVGTRSGKRQDRVLGIVERVDHVVRGARVLGTAGQHVERDRARLRLFALPVLVVAVHRDQREGVLKRHFVVAGEVGVHLRGRDKPGLLRRPRVGDVVEGLSRSQVRALLHREPAWISDARQGRLGLGNVTLRPHRMVVGHGVAPRGQGTPGVRLEGVAEGRVRLVVLERMHLQHALAEEPLAVGRPRDRELQVSQGGGRRRGRTRESVARGKEQGDKHSGHGDAELHATEDTPARGTKSLATS